MSLPINRTALIAAQTNQIPNMVIQSALNIAAIQAPYDTIDELNIKVDANYAAGNTGSTQLADGSVITSKLAPLAVTTAKIALGAVGSAQLDPSLLGNYGDIAMRAALTKMRYDVSEVPFYALGDGSDETIKIQAAVSAAIAANTKLVFFPRGTYSATALTGLDQVSLVGNNATLTVGADKVEIEQFSGISALKSRTASMYTKAIVDIGSIPSGGLKKSRASIKNKNELRVVVFGDSISEGYDIVNDEEKYASKVEQLIRNSLPGVTVNVANYGLGGRNLALATSPTYLATATEPTDVSTGFYRSWSITGLSWIDHVKAYNPDVIILAFGMNDASAIGADYNYSYYLDLFKTTVATWSTVPDIVIVPTFVQSKDHFGGSAQSQRITQTLARSTRYWAIDNGYIVADVNRLYNILINGVEDVIRVGRRELDFINYPTLWTGDLSSFVLASGVLTPNAVTNKFVSRAFNMYNGTLDMTFKQSATGASGNLVVKYRDDPAFGNMTLKIQGGATGTAALYYNTTLISTSGSINIPINTNHTLKIIANGSSHKIYVNGVLVLTVVSYRMQQDGGISIGGDGTPPIISNLSLSSLDQTTASPLYSELDLLGKYNSTDSGNAFNHPNGLGHALMYVPAFTGFINQLARSKEYADPKSIFRNGNFDRWSIGTSIVNPTTNTSYADSWKIISDAGGGTLPNITHSRGVLTSGDIPGSLYYYRKTVDGAGTSLGAIASDYFSQYIENGARFYGGRKITFDIWMRSSIVGKRVGFYAAQHYGSGGSPSATETVIGTNVTLTTTWKKYTVTLQTNTLVGKTFGTNNDDFIQIVIQDMWGSAYSFAMLSATTESFLGAGTIDYAQVNGNSGDQTVVFQPLDAEEEARKSLRYAWIPQDNSVFVRMTKYTANTLVFSLSLPVQLRTAPTIRGTINTDLVVNSMASVAQTGFTAAATTASNGVTLTLTKTAHGLTDGFIEIKTTSGLIAEQ